MGAQRRSSFWGNQDHLVVEGTSLKDDFACLRGERAGKYLEWMRGGLVTLEEQGRVLSSGSRAGGGVGGRKTSRQTFTRPSAQRSLKRDIQGVGGRGT